MRHKIDGTFLLPQNDRVGAKCSTQKSSGDKDDSIILLLSICSLEMVSSLRLVIEYSYEPRDLHNI